MLSIGTGSLESTDELPNNIRYAETRKEPRVLSNWRHLFQILTNNMKLALNCDKIWDDYYHLAAPSISGPSSKRLFRVNPTIRNVLPALDDVHRMEELRYDVRRYLVTAKPMIAEIARQLAASSFYFQLDSVEDGILDRDKVQGAQVSCSSPLLLWA